MAVRMEVFKCEKCGHIIEVLHDGKGTLSCCGEPMKLLEEKTAEAKTEKHVPVIEQTKDGVNVKVGSVPHPMEEKHFIEWIEIITSKAIYRQFLKPGDKPEATFKVSEKPLKAREHCNIHGLWKT